MTEIDIQNASTCEQIPSEDAFKHWVIAALKGAKCDLDKELTVRIVDETESQGLNLQYRGKDKPTNVLSFPADLPPEVEIPLLGDLVICAQVVQREADEQSKQVTSHWAHMVIHGTLHLLGFDHINDSEAEQMESLETSIITAMGFPAPYEDQ